MLWCVVRRRRCKPLQISQPLRGRAQGKRFLALDLPPCTSLHLTNTTFTSMPSTLGSADQTCTWFNRTSDGLTVLERRSPWPCVLPPARAGRYVRIRFHLPRNSATYHCVDAMWLTVNVAPEGKFTSPHSQVHITRHYSKVQCHLR